MNARTLKNRIEKLEYVLKEKIPEFVKSCHCEAGLVVMHQDAFAADYQPREYKLLGMAIKYAGLLGKEIRIIGKNRSTVDKKTT